MIRGKLYGARYRGKRHRYTHTITRSAIISFTLLTLLSIVSGCAGPNAAPTELSGRLKISGSTALKPLAEAAAKSFKEAHPNVSIEVAGGGSKTGIQNVTSGVSQIGNSDIYADPATYPDPRLTDHIVGVIPFTMIVNVGINVPSLKTDQIKKIFSSGEINNWSQVGGPDLPITPIVRPATSGTRSTFRTYILEGLDEKQGKLLQKDSSEDVLNAVSSTPGAIGYIAVTVVKPSVKKIAINDLQATQENITSGNYKFWSYEHMYTMGDEDPLIEAFMEFVMQSPIVNSQIRELGYIPVQEMNLPKTSSNRVPTTDSYALAPAIQPEREGPYADAA